MHQMIKSTSLVFAVFMLNINMFAQENASDLKGLFEELQNNQQEMRLEFQELKSLLSRFLTQNAQMPKAPTVPQPINIKDVEFEIGDNPVLGSDDAKLIVVEFTDYECTFCSRYVRETFPEILKEYVEKGILRYAVVDQPLPMHKSAEKAAQAAHCATDQGKYWEIHKLMMTQQDSLDDLSSYARSLQLNITEFENCLATEKYKEKVNNNTALAVKLGITGVPGFIIGLVDSQNPGNVKGISSIRGAAPFPNFQKEIESAIAVNN